ncbi:flippase [Natrinema soli]|uniref:Flippase n=1 Tax=Natrinema soli TaxID=1930624 RepID=A0ABD5SK13_9EURY|nr:flippase [Natrinema soli]
MTGSSDGLIDVLRGAGIIFLGTIIGRGIGLLGEVLLARILLPDQFGDIALAYTIVSMLAVIVTLGTAQGVPRLISGDESQERKQRLLLSGFSITISIGLLTFISLIAFSSTIGEIFGNPEMATVLPWFGLYLLTFPAARVSIGGLRGIEQSWKTVVARNSGRISGIVGLVFMIWIGAETIGAVGYYIVTQLIIALVAAYFLYEQLFAGTGRNWMPNKSEINETFSFSWPLAVSSGFLILVGNFDILMVGYFLESRQVGYYRAIQPLALLLLVILSSFVFLFMPIVTKHYKSNDINIVNNLFTSTTKLVSLIAFPIALVFVLFSEDVVVAFYGADYAPAALAFSVLATGSYLRVFVGPNAAMIKAINRTRIDMISAVAGLLVNIILNVTLIPIYGISGAAFATGVGYFVYNVIELGVVYHSIGTHPFSLNTVKPLIPTTVVAISIASLTASQSLDLIMLLVIGGVIAIIQFVSVFATQSLETTDELILQRLENRLGVDLPFVTQQIEGQNNKEEEL